jgi:hypothetical protein
MRVRAAVATTTRIIFAEPGLTLAVSGNVSVSVVRAPLTLERVGRLRREGELLLQQQGGRGRVSITIVEPPAMVSPDEELRAACAALERDLPVEFAANVLEGGGFRTAAVRAIMSGFAFATGKATSRGTYGSVAAAIDGVVRSGRASEHDGATLTALVAEARAAH